MVSHCGTSLNELINVKDLFQRTTEFVVDHRSTNGNGVYTQVSYMDYNLYMDSADFGFPPNLCTVYRLAEVLHLA